MIVSVDETCVTVAQITAARLLAHKQINGKYQSTVSLKVRLGHMFRHELRRVSYGLNERRCNWTRWTGLGCR
jgi:hypothetical protein